MYKIILWELKDCRVHYTVCPTCDRTQLAGGPLLRVATIRRTADTLLFISHTTNVPLFKFRCTIFIDRIIKEMPGSVARGTHCTTYSIQSGFYFILYMILWFYIARVYKRGIPLLQNWHCKNALIYV
jgi:hypothetical protein